MDHLKSSRTIAKDILKKIHSSGACNYFGTNDIDNESNHYAKELVTMIELELLRKLEEGKVQQAATMEILYGRK